MKQLKVIIMVAVAILVASTISVQAQNKVKVKNQEQITFSVPDMDCEHCAKKVEANIPYVKGVKDMKINIEERTVLLTYDSKKTNKAVLAKALEKIGYPATEVKKQ